MSNKVIIDGGVLEDKKVVLEMASGDQVIEGTQLTKTTRYLRNPTIIKPDTLKAENILEGVNIGGVVGTLLKQTPRELTKELDFSSGDMTIDIPEVDVNKLILVKPDTLKPENIKQNIDIAGVVGTYTSPEVTEDQKQTKTVIPKATEEVIVTPDEGKYLTSVTINQVWARTGNNQPRPLYVDSQAIAKGYSVAGVEGTGKATLGTVTLYSYTTQAMVKNTLSSSKNSYALATGTGNETLISAGYSNNSLYKMDDYGNVECWQYEGTI